MFMRMPNEYYNQIPMYPTMPMMNCRQMSSNPETMQRQFPAGSTGGPDFHMKPGPSVQQDIQYIQGWLSRLIGKYVKVEFLIGTSMLIDREGILTEVGVNYIVLKESGTKDDVLCDMYSIKFVRVFDDQQKAIICK
ncbi:hypothetical protein ACFIJ5_08240 [Haloimpatiens sp. FM7330]|uniref:hypothetical protein n=1 Tax=Haloimpatiens sp. FM7330 TaxID=3298610 RepID=UPI00363FC9AB